MAGLQSVYDLQSFESARFLGSPSCEGGTHVYGGHTFAQALLAASRALGTGWACYVANAQFLKVGLPSEPIEHLVETTSLSKNFSSQRIVSFQQHRPIMTMTASFQRPANGPDWQAEAAPRAPSADGFEPEGERFRRMVENLAGGGGGIQLLPSGIDGRWTDPQNLEAPVVKSASRQVWLRATDPVQDDPQSQQVALAFCSDFSLIETALRPFGVSWYHPSDMFATSLEHNVWFHRPTDIAQWHLCTSLCASTYSGRAFIRGEIHDGEGRLVASLAQEALFRLGSNS